MIQKKDAGRPCNLTFKSEECIHKVNSEKCLIDKMPDGYQGLLHVV